MKHARLFLVFAAIVALAGMSGTLNAQGAQDFTLINKTGVVIHKVFISPHTTDNWEENILDKDTLKDGEKVEITFDREEKADMWDLRVEDSQGNSIEWENMNLLTISEVTLYFKDGKAWATTK